MGTIKFGRSTYQSENIDLITLNDLIKNNEQIDEKTQKNINTIFNQCDIGGEGAVANDSILQGNEVKIFLSKIRDDIAEIIRKNIFSKLANSEFVEGLGNFRFDNSSNKKQIKTDIKTFDQYLNDNDYKLDKTRKELINKIRDMIKSGELTFENGISKSELENLFRLNTKTLQLIIDKKIDTTSFIINTEEAKDFISKLLENDFTQLNKTFDSVENIKILTYSLNAYKDKYGLSLYESLIQKYENNEISEDDFKTNIQNLLKNVYFYTPKNAPKELQNLNSAAKKIMTNNDFDFDAIKKFDFNRFIDEIYLSEFNFTNNQYNEKQDIKQKFLDEASKFDINKSSISNFLPKIQNTQLSDSLKIQNFNGNEYQIENLSDGIKITDVTNNQEYILDFNKMLSKIEDKDLKENAVKILKNLNALELIDLINEIDYIKIENLTSDSILASYNIEDNTISLNLKQLDRDDINWERSLTHEIGHGLDYSKKEHGYNQSTSALNSKFMEIANKELKKCQEITKDPKILFYASHKPVEMFAECYSLLMHGDIDPVSNYLLATYFPETIKCVSEIIAKQRELPSDIRKASGAEFDTRVGNW